MGKVNNSRIIARAKYGRGARQLEGESRPVPPEHAHVLRSSAPSILKDAKEVVGRSAAAEVKLPMSEVKILPKRRDTMVMRMHRWA